MYGDILLIIIFINGKTKSTELNFFFLLEIKLLINIYIKVHVTIIIFLFVVEVCKLILENANSKFI